MTHREKGLRNAAVSRVRQGLSLALTVTAITGITACSSESSLEVRDPSAYVDGLRGVNDLAHGSRIVPPMATLRDFSSTLAAQAFSGMPEAEYSSEELEGLVKRTGGSIAETTALICELPGVNHQQVAALVPGATSLSPEVPNIATVNDLPDAIDAYRSAKCMGREPRLTAETQASIREAVSTDAVLALAVVAAGLLERANAMAPSARDDLVTALSSRIDSEGCDEAILEESSALAGLGAQLPDPLLRCSQFRELSLQDSGTLDTLRAAGAEPSQVAAILRASANQTQEWTMVRESVLSDWDQPVGMGTVEATRDAVELLALTDSDLPAWVRQGIQLATNAYRSKEFVPNDAQAADLLFLCQVVLEKCPDGLLAQVENAVKSMELDTLSDRDAEVARMVKALNTTSSATVITCTPKLALKWATDAPLTLAATIARNDACLTMTNHTEQEYREYALQAANDGEIDRAIAYSQIRKYLVPVMTDTTFHDAMVTAWAKATGKLHAADQDEYLKKGRPLRLELTMAEYADAIE